MSLTLLTTTGARPKAWQICQELMRRQDYPGHVEWIVVDDGPEPQSITFKRSGWVVRVIRPMPCWAPGQNTQARNLRAGLAAIAPTARVAIIEDDDYYAPGWLDKMDMALLGHELVGEERARYYNMATHRYRQLQNVRHASLAATALRGQALRSLYDAAQDGTKFIDLRLWRDHRDGSKLLGGHAMIGVKGLPGRPGIGIGHQEQFGEPDRDGMVMRAWFGAGADLYG